LCCFFTTKPAAQLACTDDFFAQQWLTPTAKHVYATTSTPANEPFFCGYVLNNFTFTRNGWLTQLSAQGSLLWSKQYNFTFYSSLCLRAVIPAGNGQMLTAGYVSDRDTINNKDKFRVPFLLKLDRYGNAVWGFYFEKAGLGNLEINQLLQLKDGNFIVGLATGNASLLVKIDGNANILWSKGLYGSVRFVLPDFNGDMYPYFDFSIPMFVMTQLRNGHIALARAVSYPVPNTSRIENGVDIMVLHNNTGDTVWRSTWLYKDPPPNNNRPYADVKSLSELPSGDLSCITSYGESPHPTPTFSSAALNLVFNAEGQLKNAWSYTTTQPPLYCTYSNYNKLTGEQTLLLDDATRPMLLSIDSTAAIRWAKAYPTIPDIGTNGLISNTNGHYVFSSLLNGANKRFSLIKTDPNGNIECLATPLPITRTDRTTAFKRGNIPLTFDSLRGNFWPAPAGTILVRPYTMTNTTDCRKSCCTDTTGPRQLADQCLGKSFTLPNNYTATSDGDYPVVFKTSKGCDSIVSYQVKFSAPPTVDLGLDQCFGKRDTILLQGPPGYVQYQWLGVNTSQSVYPVTQPGLYHLRVRNACGTAIDSVEIFRECVFPVDMPNAFTPNGDGLNDSWGITRFNKNRLIRLQVFNRWGQIIFQTNERRQRWDGSFRQLPQSPGVYLYTLQMETLDGQPLRQRGFVNLIR
jgi:gliding motility-associated-like protein